MSTASTLVSVRSGRFPEEAAEVRRERKGLYRLTRKGGSSFFGTVKPENRTFTSEAAALAALDALPWSSEAMKKTQARKDKLRETSFKPVFYDDEEYAIRVWEERDRLHIDLFRTRDSRTVAEWWDDDARQMFEDGFFDRRNLKDSVFAYAKSHGLVVKRGVRSNPIIVSGAYHWPIRWFDEIPSGILDSEKNAFQEAKDITSASGTPGAAVKIPGSLSQVYYDPGRRAWRTEDRPGGDAAKQKTVRKWSNPSAETPEDRRLRSSRMTAHAHGAPASRHGFTYRGRDQWEPWWIDATGDYHTGTSLFTAQEAERYAQAKSEGSARPHKPFANPAPASDDVFARHQIAIAKKTLRMPDAAVGIMGGPDKAASRQILKKFGWTNARIQAWEDYKV